MSFLEVEGLGDDYEDKPVPEGEYTVRVDNIEEKTARDGVSAQVMVMLKVEDTDYPDAATIFHYLTFPGPDDEPDKRRTKMRMNTRFLKAFRVPFEKKGFNAEDINGCTATLGLKQEEYEGAMKNVLVLPAVAE
tara:strand:- start:2653 stop:3054 length:402 start_codon:yes stop_codon:yes gene_type:complete